MKYINEINKRRTFAIISHPDAGKTTLTEKLLLFGGAIQTAGAVKSNKIKKHATSDFMEIERQRGLRPATSPMRFEDKETRINLPRPNGGRPPYPGHRPGQRGRNPRPPADPTPPDALALAHCLPKPDGPRPP